MNYLLIGRPNVGKSSIFNLLTESNYNIVHSDAGTTRDWHKEFIKNTNSYIFDTPGILVDEKKNNIMNNFSFNKLLNKQIDSFLYVVDYKEGFNQNDKFSINQLRKYNKDIILIVNKFDDFKNKSIKDFDKYGLRNIAYVSCSHNFGFNDLKLLLNTEFTNVKNNLTYDFSIAIFGKPNTGKSTFLNSLVGYNRSLTSPISGTTSDYVVDFFNYQKKNIKIIDTAGINKKSNIKNNSVNFHSIKKTFENISTVDSAIIIIDSYEGIDRQDKRIIKMVSEKSKSIILIFNKLDLISNKLFYKSETIKQIKFTISEIKNIKIFFISSLNNNHVNKVFDYLFDFFFIKNNKISTNKLNILLKRIVKDYPHPLIENKRINFKYAVQIKENPVTIKIFCSYSSRIKDNYKKYLINKFNLHFKILNQKTKIIFSSSKNPYI